MEKQLRRYLLPNILAMIGTSCYILADTFFISLSQGPNGITALNLVLPLYGLIFALGSMIGIGSATRYALGKGSNAADYHLYFSNSIAWTLLVGAVFVALGVAVPDGVLRLMGADNTILQVGHNYIRIVLCFAPLFMLNFTCTAFVRNDGAPRIAMAATLLSGLFNILFDYLLMFPLGLGMTGAALATGFSPVVSMSICLLHYLSPRNTIRLIPTLPSLRRLLSACQLGVVAFVGEMSSGVTTTWRAMRRWPPTASWPTSPWWGSPSSTASPRGSSLWPVPATAPATPRARAASTATPCSSACVCPPWWWPWW